MCVFIATGRASQQKDAKQEAAMSMFIQQLKVPENDVLKAFKLLEYNNNELPVASTSAAANNLTLITEDCPANDRNNYIGKFFKEGCQRILHCFYI
jgi:hypothetical protein